MLYYPVCLFVFCLDFLSLTYQLSSTQLHCHLSFQQLMKYSTTLSKIHNSLANPLHSTKPKYWWPNTEVNSWVVMVIHVCVSVHSWSINIVEGSPSSQAVETDSSEDHPPLASYTAAALPSSSHNRASMDINKHTTHQPPDNRHTDARSVEWTRDETIVVQIGGTSLINIRDLRNNVKTCSSTISSGFQVIISVHDILSWDVGSNLTGVSPGCRGDTSFRRRLSHEGPGGPYSGKELWPNPAGAPSHRAFTFQNEGSHLSIFSFMIMLFWWDGLDRPLNIRQVHEHRVHFLADSI